MGLQVLIADPHDILRTGLHTIFASDERVAALHEASDAGELQRHLRSSPIDLVIVNHIMVSDISTLPCHRFVLLTRKFNMAAFLQAYKHGGKGYLLENSQAELFRILPSLPQGAFLIDPLLVANIVEVLTNPTRLLIKEDLLTPREREIVGLLGEGVDRHTIARQLNISHATLKTHIKNIFRKRIDTTK